MRGAPIIPHPAARSNRGGGTIRVMTPIYLDHNATTPLLPEAWEAMRRSRPRRSATRRRPTTPAGRPGSTWRTPGSGWPRSGAHPDEVIFTSGATEANNLAIFGLATEPGHLLAALIEHPCVVEPLRQLAGRGFDLDWLPVTCRGHVETAAVRERVREDTRLVCLMLANHETGAIQPVRHVAKTLPKPIPLHCDAAQAVGKVPVNFRDLGVTTLSASAHKFRGPKGVGLLLLKRGTKLRPLLHGGHQQRGHRPGTEPVALAVGLAVALEYAVRDMDANRAKVEGLRRRLLERLRSLLTPSPLGGEGWGGGSEASTGREHRSSRVGLTPHPNPPPQGGREQEPEGREQEAVILNGPAPGDADGTADHTQRLLPRLSGGRVAGPPRPRRDRLLDRLGLLQREPVALAGASGDGRAGRSPPLRDPLQPGSDAHRGRRR